MRILISTDGSHCARSIPRDLAQAGLPPHAQALLLSVTEMFNESQTVEPYISIAGGNASLLQVKLEHSKETASVHLKELSVELLKYFPEWYITTNISSGSPASVILDIAEKWSANYVVVGCHGYTNDDRFFLGSITTKVITEAPCTIRVSKPIGIDQTDNTPKVLLCLDGSKESSKAAESLMGRNWPMDSILYIATIVNFDIRSQHPSDEIAQKILADYSEDYHTWINRMHDYYAGMLRPCFHTVIPIVNTGNPKFELLRIAESLHINTILVGARGISSSSSCQLGSVAYAIAQRAHCSVEITKL